MGNKRQGQKIDTGKKDPLGRPIYNWVNEDNNSTLKDSEILNISSDFKEDDNGDTLMDITDYYSEDVPEIEQHLDNLTSNLDKTVILDQKSSEELFDTIVDEQYKNDSFYSSSKKMDLDVDTEDILYSSHKRLNNELYNYNLVYLAMSDEKPQAEDLKTGIKTKMLRNGLEKENVEVEVVHIKDGNYTITMDNGSKYIFTPNNMKNFLLDKQLDKDDYTVVKQENRPYLHTTFIN